MPLPIQVSFRSAAGSPAVEEAIRARASQLDRFRDHITSCRVVVDVPHQTQQNADRYQLRLDVAAPGYEFTVSHTEEADRPGAKSLTAAVPEVFDVADRLLDAYARRHPTRHP